MVLLAIAITMNAQGNETKNAFFDRLHFELKTSYGTKQHGMTPINASLQLSYEFVKCLSLLATAEGDYSLFKQDDSQWWTKDFSLGGGLAYAFYDGNNERYDLRLQVLNTVGSNDRKFTTFDVGTTWYGKSSSHGVVPVLGFGIRHQKSHTTGIRDWTGFYATVGIRF